MLKKLLLFVVAVIAAFAVYVAQKPAEYAIARSAVIPAAPEAVFPHINNLKKWQAWSPWAKLDPNVKLSYSGPEAGEGAAHTWAGNSDIGAGTISIIESAPNEKVRFRLDFTQPFQSTADSDFDLEAVDGGTKVTWSLTGRQSFVERFMCTLMMVDLDAIVGRDYEQGLENLKAVVAGSQT